MSKWRPRFNKICWRRDRLPTPVFLGFHGGSAGKESACNTGDLGSISGLGRCAGEGKGYPLQYSDLENSMDCIVHGVTKRWTWLGDFHLRNSQVVLVVRNLPASAGDRRAAGLIPGGPLEEATYSSILAWWIPMDRGTLWATVYRVRKESDTTEVT